MPSILYRRLPGVQLADQPRLRGRLGCLLAMLAAIGLLLIVPIYGHQYVSGSPEIFSNDDSGIVILPTWVYASRKPLAQTLWCGFLGWFGPASCLPDIRLSGLHVWFLRDSGTEYHAVAPFPVQSAAYIYDGKLRWFRGRETWQWEGRSFRRLGESEAGDPFREHRSIGDLIEAEGWIQHRVDNAHQTISVGLYRINYSRPILDDGPTEIAIEAGPVVGTLYSRTENWHFTGFAERIPDFSLQDQE